MLGLLVAVLVFGFLLISIKKHRDMCTLEIGQCSLSRWTHWPLWAWRVMWPKVKAFPETQLLPPAQVTASWILLATPGPSEL